MSDRRCTATTKQGKPCRSRPLAGSDKCLAHSDAQTRTDLHFVSQGRPRRPREIELVQEVADEFKAQMRAVLTDGLVADRAVVVGNGPTAYVETVPDHPQRLATFKEIIDRLHGKPQQTTTIDSHGPLVNLNLVTDGILRTEAADLRRRLALDRAVEPRGFDVGGGAELDSATTH